MTTATPRHTSNLVPRPEGTTPALVGGRYAHVVPVAGAVRPHLQAIVDAATSANWTVGVVKRHDTDDHVVRAERGGAVLVVEGDGSRLTRATFRRRGVRKAASIETTTAAKLLTA